MKNQPSSANEGGASPESEFVATATKSGTIINHYTGHSPEVRIPAEIKGSPVIRIGSGSFDQCNTLVSVTIPDGVECVDSKAFWSCQALESVRFPRKIRNIGEFAFWDCVSLAEADLSSSDLTSSDGSIGHSAFEWCRSLKSIAIPMVFGRLDANAFAQCAGLERIGIRGAVKTIAESTLAGCRSLASLTIPNGVTSIGAKAFSGCSGLVSIEVPDTVGSIESSAFRGCVALRTAVCLGGDPAFKHVPAMLVSGLADIEGVRLPDLMARLASPETWRTESMTIPKGHGAIAATAEFVLCLSNAKETPLPEAAYDAFRLAARLAGPFAVAGRICQTKSGSSGAFKPEEALFADNCWLPAANRGARRSVCAKTIAPYLTAALSVIGEPRSLSEAPAIADRSHDAGRGPSL